MTLTIANELQDFAQQHGLTGLTEPTLKAIKEKQPGYTPEKGKRFLNFQQRINKELLNHRVITNNKFTAWFKKGEMSEAQLKVFITQFSVFSNLFLIAQLKKTINADTLDRMRASKEILANEIGVIFRNPNQKIRRSAQPDKEGDPELVSTEGTVDGGVFQFQAGHFEWLVRLSERMGLKFNEIGKRRHGSKATLFFCDELARLYGNEDYAVSQAASYAVENWAAAGFWKELVEGLEKYRKKYNKDFSIAFFTWHDKLEDQHARHTQEELEEYYFHEKFNEDAFIKYGNEMMGGIAAFWDGLEEQRKQIQ